MTGLIPLLLFGCVVRYGPDPEAAAATSVQDGAAVEPRRAKERPDYTALEAELLVSVGPDLDRTLDTDRRGERPAVIMVVGVNGSGKTTSIAKLAQMFCGQGRKVVLGAGDELAFLPPVSGG